MPLGWHAKVMSFVNPRAEAESQELFLVLSIFFKFANFASVISSLITALLNDSCRLSNCRAKPGKTWQRGVAWLILDGPQTLPRLQLPC